MAIFAISLLGLLALATRPVWTLDPDASAYLTLGRAVAAGHGYTLDAPLPGAAGSLTGPPAASLPHAKYPPGWPLMLAAVIQVSGPEAYRSFHLTLVALLAGAVLVAYRLVLRLGYAPVLALAVALCVGLTQTFFDLSVVYLRTEVPFLLLSTAALLVLLRPRLTWRTVLLGALLTAAATSVRLAGVALLTVPALRVLWPDGSGGTCPPTDAARCGSGAAGNPRLRAAALVLLALLPLVAWQVRAAGIQSAHPEAADYGTEFWAPEPRDLTKTVRVDMPPMDAAAWVHRVGGNLEVLARASAVLLTNVDRAAHRLPVGALALAVLVLGMTSLWRAGGARRLAVAYLAGSLGLYLIWPFNQQERFYAPLLPLLLLAAGEGLVTGMRLVQAAAARPAARTLVTLVGLATLIVLAAQRSDYPTLLGRWSLSYAALLLGAAAAWVALVVALRRPRPLPAARTALLLPLIFALPFLNHVVREWPAQKRAFEQRRAAQPVDPGLAAIDVHPLLEQVALYLREQTPPDTVVMTDVPKMLAILSGRRCVPFRYRADPPEVIVDEADEVFYTGEIPEVAAVLAGVAGQFDLALELRDGDDTVVGHVYTVR